MMSSLVNKNTLGLAMAVTLAILAGTIEARVYDDGSKPKAFIITGVVTIQFEDNVDLSSVAKSFGRVSFNLPTLDAILDRFEVSSTKSLFPWVSEQPDANSSQPDLTRYYEISYPDSIDVQTIIDALMQNPNVKLAEAVWALPLDVVPNDPLYNSQWALRAPPPDPYFYDAWDLETGADTIKYGAIDSGVNYKHPDLVNNIWVNPGEDLDGDGVVYDIDDLNGMDDDGNGIVDDLIGYDFFSGFGGGLGVWPGEDGGGQDSDPNDHNGHGSHIAGIGAAVTNNAIDVAGAAGGWLGGHRSYRGVQIVCLRVGGTADDGMGYVNSNNCGTALSYAAMVGVNVVNCSWGSQNTSAMAAGMAACAAAGVTVCHAAGNDNADDPDYLDFNPSTNVLSVAALGPNSDVKAGFSNFGNWIDVSAPGVDILSTYSSAYTPTIASLGGTSMASPMVAGLALLIRSMMPSLTKDQVDSLIINTADDISSVNDSFHLGRLGSGRINAHSALSALANAKFTSDVSDGSVPLTVNFTDLSPNSPVAWDWSFGAGGSSTMQNPTHVYNTPGIYDVSLVIDEGNPLGPGEEHLKNYVWVRADTTTIDSSIGLVGTKTIVSVRLTNTVLVKQIRLVLSLNNALGVTIDSVSAVGLRTEYFNSVVMDGLDLFNNRVSILLTTDAPGGSTYLTADTGVVVNLHLDVSSGGSAGIMTIDTTTFSGKTTTVSTIWGDYVPEFSAGILTITACARGDITCNQTIDIEDLTALVAFMFGGAPTPDPYATDVDGSGGTDIADLTYLVAYMFGGGPPPPP